MKEFILFFRMDITVEYPAEQMHVYMQQWQSWIDEIASNQQLAGGNHLLTQGRVVDSHQEIKNKPYTESNMSVAGYIIIKAHDLDGATQIAQHCPILAGKGNTVEVREIAVL